MTHAAAIGYALWSRIQLCRELTSLCVRDGRLLRCVASQSPTHTPARPHSQAAERGKGTTLGSQQMQEKAGWLAGLAKRQAGSQALSPARFGPRRACEARAWGEAANPIAVRFLLPFPRSSQFVVGEQTVVVVVCSARVASVAQSLPRLP